MGNAGNRRIRVDDLNVADVVAAAERGDARTMWRLMTEFSNENRHDVNAVAFEVAVAALRNRSTPILTALKTRFAAAVNGIQEHSGESLVAIAAADGDSADHRDVVRFLIDNMNTSVDTMDRSGALHAAARKDHSGVAKILLEARASPNAVSNGQTPIFTSLEFNSNRTFKLLEDAGQRVTLRELTGAAERCTLDLFQRGLEHLGGWGAIGDNDRQSVLVRASRSWDWAVAEFVLRYGCAGNGNAFDGIRTDTALQAAVSFGHPNMALLLLQGGAWPNQNADGNHDGEDDVYFALAADEGSEGGGAEKMAHLLAHGCRPSQAALQRSRASALAHDNADVAQLLVDKYPMTRDMFHSALGEESYPCPAPVRVFYEACQPDSWSSTLELVKGVVERMCGGMPLQLMQKRDLMQVVLILTQRPRRVNYYEMSRVSQDWSQHDVVDIVRPIRNREFQKQMALEIVAKTHYKSRTPRFTEDVLKMLDALHGGAPHEPDQPEDDVYDKDDHVLQLDRRREEF